MPKGAIAGFYGSPMLIFVFKKLSNCFPECNILHYHQQYMNHPVYLNPWQHLMLSLFFFRHSNGCVGLSHMVLICISPTAIDVWTYIQVHIFSCISSLVSCLFLSFAHFLIGLFTLSNWAVYFCWDFRVLYIF